MENLNSAMETYISLSKQTAGKDKQARLVQYLCRVLWSRLQKSDVDSADNLKSLEFKFSTFRKLLRFGQSLETFYSIGPLFHYDDAPVRVTVIMGKICHALYLLCDHILWLGRADINNVDSTKWSRFANKYWLYSITMNLVRDFYEISQILKCHKYKILPVMGVTGVRDIYEILFRALVYIQRYPPVVIDTIKNSCDFFLPLTALEYIKLSPGTTGILGVISSIAGIVALVQPSAKLIP